MVAVGPGRRFATVLRLVVAAGIAVAIWLALGAWVASLPQLAPATAWAQVAESESKSEDATGLSVSGTGAAQASAERASTGATTLNGMLGGNRGILPAGLGEDAATYTTIARLAGADESLNETLVAFRGEVVGEPINSIRDGYRWVLMQSYVGSTSSIQVLMSDELVSQIENYGSYKTKGTTLHVTGVYRVADPNQMGALDVTAYAVRVQDPGGPIEHDVDLSRLWIGLALVAVGAILCLINVYLKWRSHS